MFLACLPHAPLTLRCMRLWHSHLLAQVDLGLTQQIMASTAGQEVTKRGIPMIGESGIFTPEHVQTVSDAGCQGILVGESIVKNGDFEQAVKTLLSRT
jgi:indole-3-glycerol phosphate synthase